MSFRLRKILVFWEQDELQHRQRVSFPRIDDFDEATPRMCAAGGGGAAAGEVQRADAVTGRDSKRVIAILSVESQRGDVAGNVDGDLVVE